MALKIRAAVGAIELLIAALLIAVVLRLPTAAEVTRRLDGTLQLTQGAEAQIQLMHRQVAAVRRHDLARTVAQLRNEGSRLAEVWSGSGVDVQTIESLAESLKQTAMRLDEWGRYVPTGERRSWKVAAEADSVATTANEDLIAAVVGCSARAGVTRGRQEKATETPSGNLSFDARQALRETERTLARTGDQLQTLSATRLPVATPRGLNYQPVWPEGEQTARQVHEACANIRKINDALDRHGWPDDDGSIHRAAAALHESHRQLLAVLDRRLPCERAMTNGRRLAESTDTLISSASAPFSEALTETERNLASIGEGLSAVNDSAPSFISEFAAAVWMLKVCFTVLGTLIGIHGMLLLVRVSRGRQE